LDTNKIIDDTILDIPDYTYGLEDARLFEHNDNIYINATITMGKNEKLTVPDNRMLRQSIVLLGTKTDLLNNKLPLKKFNVNINCIKLHESNIEKNWFGYNKDNRHIIVNPSFGNFFPLHQYILDLNNLEELSDSSSEFHYTEYKKYKSYVCEKSTDIIEENIIKDINNYYKDCLKDNTKNLFRLSGGSWGIPYDEHVLFVGHIVVYVNLLEFDKVQNMLNTKNTKSNNLYSFIKNRNHQLKMRYYQVLFKININTNKLTELSHSFNIFEKVSDDTSVNFPMGLIKNNDEYIISFGESDYKTCLIKLSKENIDKLFTNISPENYKFITFSNDIHKEICYYDEDTNNYKQKYLKYKQKYLELKNI